MAEVPRNSTPSHLAFIGMVGVLVFMTIALVLGMAMAMLNLHSFTEKRNDESRYIHSSKSDETVVQRREYPSPPTPNIAPYRGGAQPYV